MFFGAPFSGCPFIVQGRAGLPSRSLCDTEALLQLPLGTTRAIQSAVQSRPSVRNIWTVPNKAPTISQGHHGGQCTKEFKDGSYTYYCCRFYDHSMKFFDFFYAMTFIQKKTVYLTSII